MAEEKREYPDAVQGVADGVAGKAKEVWGAVTGNDDLVDEGRAQRGKGEAHREAAQKDAEAAIARGKADAAGKLQDAKDEAKEDDEDDK
jgi:uncharacterized protein YjbJ (UPF0337 family)